MITNEERKRFRACHFSAHRRGATLISLPASTLATVSARLVPGVVPHRYRMSNESRRVVSSIATDADGSRT
jgi:hypothetical protein